MKKAFAALLAVVAVVCAALLYGGVNNGEPSQTYGAPNNGYKVTAVRESIGGVNNGEPSQTDEAPNNGYKVAAVRESIDGGLPVFAFTAESIGVQRYDGTYNCEFRDVQTITITDGFGREVQKICVPEYSVFGGTRFRVYPEKPEITLIDANFDGYKDIMLEDGVNGVREYAYIFFLWDAAAGRFEYDEPLNSIINPEIDEENKIIRGSYLGAGSVCYSESAYKYIGGVLTETYYLTKTWVRFEDSLRQYLDDTGQTEDADVSFDFGAGYAVYRKAEWERDETTGEWALLRAEYVKYFIDDEYESAVAETFDISDKLTEYDRPFSDE